MDLITVIPIIIAAVLAAIFGHAAFLKRKDKDALDAATTSIIKLETKLTTLESRLVSIDLSLAAKLAAVEGRVLSETKVKALIAEDTRELKGEIKALSELISKLRIDLGVLNYINNRESTRDD